ncbi:hypothetical protein H0H92_005596 [Tricholoma furcatifolium]|nr:hypothetical protein H0H92_005596 [Tricholoma furcatifolium]
MATPFNVENFVVPGYGHPKNGELTETEAFWRKYSQLFKERGYTVRPRYRPDWIPSWWNTSKHPSDCEDSIPNFAKHLDAVGPDGSIVMIKWVEPLETPAEIPVGKLLCSERLASPRNHCMPYLDVIERPESPDVAFIVMPYLIRTERARFETIGEAVEFFRQIFEGLEFMHENNIRHGDCKYDNIMADSIHLFRSPPHPFTVRPTLDFSGRPFPIFSRTQKPVKYYLIDFDLAKEYPPRTPRLERLPWGGDRSVPEHQGARHLTPNQGFEFMRELADDMTNANPSKRPTMKEATLRLNTIIEGLSDHKLRSPLAVLKAHRKMSFRRRIAYWTKQYIRKAHDTDG